MLVLYEFGPGTLIMHKVPCSQGTGNLLGTAASFICHLLLAIYFRFCKCYDEQHCCAYRFFVLFFFLQILDYFFRKNCKKTAILLSKRLVPLYNIYSDICSISFATSDQPWILSFIIFSGGEG